MAETHLEFVKRMEQAGELDPECAYCQAEQYAYLGQLAYDGEAPRLQHAPSHKPSDRCESGKRPHCTCDTCF
ncbi:MAG TPA: hypothetical protein VF653_00980 [Methylomirabilota bacterium]